MRMVHGVAIAMVAGAVLGAAACSSSDARPPADGGILDAAPDVTLDAPLGPMVCNVPVAASCPLTAPCSFGSWGCAAAPCQGYLVVSDGTSVYYYSASGGELVGEVPVGIAEGTSDGGIVECPYGFEFPPTSACPAVLASACGADAGPEDGGALDSGGPG
ncbi:MAG TPA: hypothetical protein VGI39_26005 [Polyangiaceae bacterium]|jgi:hypothetical protein